MTAITPSHLHSGANFGIERTLETLDSSVVWLRNSLDELAAIGEGNL